MASTIHQSLHAGEHYEEHYQEQYEAHPAAELPRHKSLADLGLDSLGFVSDDDEPAPDPPPTQQPPAYHAGYGAEGESGAAGWRPGQVGTSG